MLNEQKLVEIIPSSGTFVAPINQEDIKHVYQLLGGLQALALKLCIGTVTAEDLEHLNSLNENFLRCAQMGAVPATIEADYQFHRYLCQLSGNPYLVNYSDQLSIHVSRNENRFLRFTPPRRSATPATSGLSRPCAPATWRPPRRRSRPTGPCPPCRMRGKLPAACRGKQKTNKTPATDACLTGKAASVAEVFICFLGYRASARKGPRLSFYLNIPDTSAAAVLPPRTISSHCSSNQLQITPP